MKKLTDLRRHLLDAVPGLAAHPGRLLTFVDSGRIEFHRGTNYDHRYRYTARLIATDYRGETDAIIIPLLYWLAIHEPHLDPQQAVAFEAEILDNESCDLDLTVQLDERVRARLATFETREDSDSAEAGRIDVEHLAPRHRLDLIAPPPRFEVYLRNHGADHGYQRVAEWPVPGDAV